MANNKWKKDKINISNHCQDTVQSVFIIHNNVKRLSISITVQKKKAYYNLPNRFCWSQKEKLRELWSGDYLCCRDWVCVGCIASSFLPPPHPLSFNDSQSAGEHDDALLQLQTSGNQCAELLRAAVTQINMLRQIAPSKNHLSSLSARVLDIRRGWWEWLQQGGLGKVLLGQKKKERLSLLCLVLLLLWIDEQSGYVKAKVKWLLPYLGAYVTLL